jgi:hypothetical protein
MIRPEHRTAGLISHAAAWSMYNASGKVSCLVIHGSLDGGDRENLLIIPARVCSTYPWSMCLDWSEVNVGIKRSY